MLLVLVHQPSKRRRSCRGARYRRRQRPRFSAPAPTSAVEVDHQFGERHVPSASAAPAHRWYLKQDDLRTPVQSASRVTLEEAVVGLDVAPFEVSLLGTRMKAGNA